MIVIQPLPEANWPAVWGFLEPVFRAGETYAVDPGITGAAARHTWLEAPLACFGAMEGDRLVGSYYLKANQAGPGAHVCNCGYVTAPDMRGKGIASAMCVHSLGEARRHGFRAMQFNMVASSNEGAVRLWKRHGFEIVGTLPEAFNHPANGYVDAYVMFKKLS